MQKLIASPSAAPATRDSRRLQQRARQLLAWAERSDRNTFLAILVLVAYVFSLTAHWTRHPINDAEAAYGPAWWFVHQGTFFLDRAPHLPKIAWFVHTHGHVVSNRTAGVILVGVPFQAV